MVNKRRPNLKRLAPPILVAWAVTLGLAFWLGRGSVAKSPQVAGARPSELSEAVELATVEGLAPELGEAPTAIGDGLEETTVESKQAYQILAAAEDYLAGGAFSQRGVLKVFAAMEELDEDSVIDAMREVEAMEVTAPNRGLFMLAVVGRWAEFDPGSAMKYAEQYLTGDLRTGVITNVVSSWAEKDAAGALRWYQKSRDEGELSMALGTAAHPLMTTIFQGLAGSQPESAFAELGKLDGEEFRHALVGMVSAMTAAGKSELLLDHIGRLPEARQLDTRRGVIRQWAQSAPKEAAHWVDRMRASTERDDLSLQVGLQWVRRQPEQAIPWMLERIPEVRHPETLASAVGIWARTDPNAAAEWIGKIDPGPAIDPAIASLSRQIITRDPESAVAWAATIDNPAMRDQTVATVFAQWMIRERSIALAYLESSNLPTEQLQVLRRMADEDR